MASIGSIWGLQAKHWGDLKDLFQPPKLSDRSTLDIPLTGERTPEGQAHGKPPPLSFIWVKRDIHTPTHTHVRIHTHSLAHTQPNRPLSQGPVCKIC